MQTPKKNTACQAGQPSTTNRLTAKIWLAAFLVMALLTLPAQAGVTVIAHGWKWTADPAGFPAWVGTMVQAFTNVAYQRGLNSSWHHRRIHGDIFSGFTSSLSRVSAVTAAEVVVTVDWSDISDNTDLYEGAVIRTDDVGQWIAG